MDRSFVKKEFQGLGHDLLSIQLDLSRQIRRQSKSIILEKWLKRLKKSVVVLMGLKPNVDQNVNRLCQIRNSLGPFITSEPHQSLHEFSEEEGIDTENISNDSATDSETEEFNNQVSGKAG